MRNPFIVVRLVFLSFLLYLNVLAMGFAAWNVVALRNAQLDVDGAPAFIIFNACCLIGYVILCFAEPLLPLVWAPTVMFECMWGGISCMLQLASAVDVTINGPILTCRLKSYPSACASSSLLVAVTWISSSAIFLYFLFLVCMSAVHATNQPALWGASVTTVPWFAYPRATVPSQQPAPSTKDVERGPYENPVFKEDEALSPVSSIGRSEYSIECDRKQYSLAKGLSISKPQSQSVESFRPSWAKIVNPRRGVDLPFVAQPKPVPVPVRDRLKSYWSSTTTYSVAPISPVPPVPPPKARLGPAHRNGRIEDNCQYITSVVSDASLPIIMPSPSRPISYGVFPDYVENLDAPIHAPHRSQWVAADDASSSHRGTSPSGSC